LSLYFFYSKIVCLVSRWFTFSSSFILLLLNFTSMAYLLVHSFSILSNYWSFSSLFLFMFPNSTSYGLLPTLSTLLYNSSYILLSLPTSFYFFSFKSWPYLIIISNLSTISSWLYFTVITSYFFFSSTSIYAPVFSPSNYTLLISFIIFSSSTSLSSISNAIFIACFYKLAAVFSMFLCSLILFINFSYSFLEALCNDIILFSIKFIWSSVSFCFNSTFFIDCSVFFNDFYNNLYWASNFSLSCFFFYLSFSSPSISFFNLIFYWFNTSFTWSSFLISPSIPINSVPNYILISF